MLKHWHDSHNWPKQQRHTHLNVYVVDEIKSKASILPSQWECWPTIKTFTNRHLRVFTVNSLYAIQYFCIENFPICHSFIQSKFQRTLVLSYHKIFNTKCNVFYTKIIKDKKHLRGCSFVDTNVTHIFMTVCHD